MNEKSATFMAIMITLFWFLDNKFPGTYNRYVETIGSKINRIVLTLLLQQKSTVQNVILHVSAWYSTGGLSHLPFVFVTASCRTCHMLEFSMYFSHSSVRLDKSSSGGGGGSSNKAALLRLLLHLISRADRLLTAWALLAQKYSYCSVKLQSC